VPAASAALEDRGDKKWHNDVALRVTATDTGIVVADEIDVMNSCVIGALAIGEYALAQRYRC
jgi:hypothetical protein